MDFWDNVAIELDYLGMTGKALAEKAGIAASSIAKGKSLGSSPSADTAVKIAKILGVSVEYLVSGKQSNTVIENRTISSEEIRNFKKYSSFIDNLERLPSYEKTIIIEMVEKLSLAQKK